MSGFFSDAYLKAMKTGKYICPECGHKMRWEDEWEDTLVCDKCGFSEEGDHYGYTDEEYEALFPTKEQVCGYDDDDE